MAVKSFSRSRSTRHKALSGIDLPEVAPDQGIEVRPAERESYIAPQPRYANTRYASGLESLHTEDAKGPAIAVHPDDTASTKGFFPSTSKPHITEKVPFWRNKKARWWIIGAAFVAGLLLAVIIAVAVTLSVSRKPSSPSPVAATVTASPSTTSTAPSTSTASSKGCPSYTGPPLSTLPSSLTRPGGPAPTPANSNKKMKITFSQSFSYDIANTDQTTTSNAFTSIPQGFAYALNGDVASSFIINKFKPIDTTPQQCYIATTAEVDMPGQYTDSLQQQVIAPRNDGSVRLWHNPNGNTADLFNKISNITFE